MTRVAAPDPFAARCDPTPGVVPDHAADANALLIARRCATVGQKIGIGSNPQADLCV